MKLCSVISLLIILISNNVKAQDRFWIHKPNYQNFFNSASDLAEWNLIEDNGTGSFSLSGTGLAILKMDDASGNFANRIFSVNNGAVRYLPLDSINGRLEINIARTTGGTQRFFVQAQTFTSSNTYINQLTLLPATVGNGFFSVGMKGIAWPANADKIRFIIGGENYSGQQGTIEFDYLSYANTNGSWNNTANWAASSNGVGGASVPGSNNKAIFDGVATSNGSCQIANAVSVLGVSMAAGYNGNIALDNANLNIGSEGLLIAGGGFSGGSSDINIGGKLEISGGLFINTDKTTNIGGNLNIVANPFSLNKGSLAFNGSDPQTIFTRPGVTIRKAILDKPSTLTLLSNIIILDSLVLANGVINTQDDTVRLGTSLTSRGIIAQGNGKINGKAQISIVQAGPITVPFGTLSASAPITINFLTAPASYKSAVLFYRDYGNNTTPVNFMDGSSNIINRSQTQWSISTGSTIQGEYQLSASIDNLGYMGAVSDLHLVLANGVTGNHVTASGSLSNPIVGRTNLLLGEVTNSFYVGMAANALPVKWLYFNAELQSDNTALITWKTEENSVKSYEVQRSVDGHTFGTIAEIKSPGHFIQDYRYNDKGFAGNAYYRIKSIDLDRLENFSSIMKVIQKESRLWSLNPMTNQENINITVNQFNNSSTISVLDMQGRLYYTTKVTSHNLSIPLTNFGKGIYQILLRHNGSQYLLRFTKK